MHSIQSRYFSHASIAFNKSFYLLWEQGGGGSNPSAPTIAITCCGSGLQGPHLCLDPLSGAQVTTVLPPAQKNTPRDRAISCP
jgi:hypothetical protein